MNNECRTEKCRISKGGGRPAACVLSDGGGLDDWEVEIADFVPSTAKPSTRQVFCWGKVFDATN